MKKCLASTLFLLFIFSCMFICSGQLQPGGANVCKETVNNITVVKCCKNYEEKVDQCSPVCSQACKQGNCTSPNTCTCETGYSGKTCDSAVCSQACKQGSCTSPNTCTCETGYSGKTCDTAVCSQACKQGNCTSPNTCTCETGYSGKTCDSAVCSQACKQGSCTSPNTCTCETGYSGKTCDTAVCSQACKQGNCTSPNTCTCETGYSGKTCDTAMCSQACKQGSCTSPNTCTCETGYSGKTCDTAMCSQACKQGNCTSPNTCTCETGYTGKTCDTAVCSQACKQGNCTSPNTCTCETGYTGKSCDTDVDECISNPCSHICNNFNGTYNCSCYAGYKPIDGKPHLCQDVDECESNPCSQKCHNFNGTFNCSCDPGYKTVRSSQCEECSSTTYGVDCENQCQCQNSGWCDKRTGSCNCTAGWEGMFCEKPCNNSWGEYCKNALTCDLANTKYTDHVTGKCSCKPGYRGKDCDTKCPAWSYGLNCLSKCKCLLENSMSCDHRNGSCYCEEGWGGERCIDISCDDEWKYGVDCQNDCQCNRNNTESCDSATGNCNCRKGWTENICNAPLKDGKKELPSWVVGAAIGGCAFLLLCSVIIIIWCWRKKSILKPNVKSRISKFNEKNPEILESDHYTSLSQTYNDDYEMTNFTKTEFGEGNKINDESVDYVLVNTKISFGGEAANQQKQRQPKSYDNPGLQRADNEIKINGHDIDDDNRQYLSLNCTHANPINKIPLLEEDNLYDCVNMNIQDKKELYTKNVNEEITYANLPSPHAIYGNVTDT